MPIRRVRRFRGLPARVVVTVPAVCLLACTSGTAGDAASSTARPPGGTSTPPSTAAASGTPTATATSGTPTAPPATSTSSTPGVIPCTPTVSELSVEGGLAAVGHTGFLVHVRNASRQPCLTIGYPGVDLLGADGRTLAHASRTLRGHLGGLSTGTSAPQLRLEPGDEATAVVEGADDAGGSGSCVGATAIRFTLPDNTDSTVLRVQIPFCGEVEIHPLLAGDTGSA